MVFGEFFDFDRSGVPVIANDIPNMKELVETNQCGIFLRNFDNLPKALTKLRKDLS